MFEQLFFSFCMLQKDEHNPVACPEHDEDKIAKYEDLNEGK